MNPATTTSRASTYCTSSTLARVVAIDPVPGAPSMTVSVPSGRSFLLSPVVGSSASSSFASFNPAAGALVPPVRSESCTADAGL